jgi:AcrR family transcriptional regulator
MTMDQVAVSAGVSKPTIYLRFGSKAALVAAMIDRLEPPLPRPRGRSARADLVTLIQVEEQWVGRHGRRLVAAVLLEEADHPELLDQFRQRVVEPVRAAFYATLKAGIARGELRQGANRAEVIDALTGAYWARFGPQEPPSSNRGHRRAEGRRPAAPERAFTRLGLPLSGGPRRRAACGRRLVTLRRR